MGGKQSTAGRPRGAFPGVSTDDSAVPPSAHFGHYRPSARWACGAARSALWPEWA
ncbi:unnamed protein product [Tetraodon nigroviridis]|uniref:(spotted green pufferfish) hypothetical protein n=1 Tax=Tetraodon nigroviridis TaxID=99883 RepID=Q4RCE9_TETNG|nr:unnamed protein product [Tetraodon nigroviridis]